MVDKVRIDTLLEELNSALGSVTPYKLALVDPGEVKPVDKNAHYMTKRVYDQLRDNVQRDGNLSSLPFCWRHPDGRMESLSGNHRVLAARDAEVPLMLVLYTDAELSKAERIAIQLSHNALVGADNPTTLRELWTEIDALSLKVYSGLDEQYLATLDTVEVLRVDEAHLRMEELALMFLPSEIDRIEHLLKRLGSTRRRRFAAQVEAFDAFFEALLQFKEAQGIVNSSTAILALVEIAREWLEHNEVEHHGVVEE